MQAKIIVEYASQKVNLILDWHNGTTAVFPPVGPAFATRRVVLPRLTFVPLADPPPTLARFAAIALSTQTPDRVK